MAASSDDPPFAGRPPAPLRLAASLEGAERRALVHLDEQGRVRSPLRLRALEAASALGSVAFVAGTGAAYGLLLGPGFGVVAGAVLGGVLVVQAGRLRRMREAAALIADDRVVEAEALCRDVLDAWLVPSSLRATAHHDLAVIAARRGDFHEALHDLREAIRLRGGRGLEVDVLAYLEIGLLARIGRVVEARARLLARGAVPAGDYLRLLHWTAELTVLFVEGRCTLDEDDRWERSRRALALGVATELVALCAFAHAAHGEEEMADHLVAEALDRAPAASHVAFPALWAWAAARRAAK